MENLAFIASYVSLWVIVVVQSIVMLALVRTTYQARDASSGARGLLKGQRAPGFNGFDALTGQAVSSETLVGKFSALLFVSPRCPSCLTTLDELHAVYHKAKGNVVLICGGETEECARIARRYDLSLPTVVDSDNRIRDRYGAVTTPYAVLINEVGEIEFTGQPVRADELEQLLKQDPRVVAQPVES